MRWYQAKIRSPVQEVTIQKRARVKRNRSLVHQTADKANNRRISDTQTASGEKGSEGESSSSGTGKEQKSDTQQQDSGRDTKDKLAQGEQKEASDSEKKDSKSMGDGQTTREGQGGQRDSTTEDSGTEVDIR